MARQPSSALTATASSFREHTQLDTSHSVGLIGTSDQPLAETWPVPDNTQHTQETDIHPCTRHSQQTCGRRPMP